MDNNQENNNQVEEMDDSWGGIIGDAADWADSISNQEESEKIETQEVAVEANAQESIEVQKEETPEVPRKAAEDAGEVKTEEGNSSTGGVFDEDSFKQIDKIKIKVDGEMREVSGQEAYNAITGGLGFDKKFRELDNEKKSLYSRLEQDQKVKQDFAELLKTDPLGALADFTGQPVYALKDILIKAATPELVRRQEMDPSQLEAYKAQQMAEHYKQQLDATVEAEKKKQEESAKAAAQNAVQEKVSAAKSRLGVSEEQWDKALFELDRKLPPGQEIFVEDVEKYIAESNSVPQVTSDQMLTSVVEPYANIVNDEFKSKLKQYIELNPNESKENIDQVVKQALAIHTKRELLGEESNSVAHKPNDQSHLSAQERFEVQEEMERREIAGIYDEDNPFD